MSRLPGKIIKKSYDFLAHLSHALASANIVVVLHNVQTSSPLKPLGQSNPNFIWSLLGKGERKLV